ncbi:hypothetical protein ABT294_09285 [Nonomuraea sp. NPDC000554]|uniref:hypothetical protein n=1 Tax=Nonomuraea sp. NPDC000554 TaxID=3154259 RepID=UPI00331E43EE
MSSEADLILPLGVKAAFELVGVRYPNIRTSEMHLDAAAVRTVLAGTAPVAAEADATMRLTEQAYQGESGTALTGHWKRAGGHLSKAADALRPAPMALDLTAEVVRIAQAALISQAAHAAWKAGRAFLAGGPLGAGRASAELLLARHMMGKIRHELREGTTALLAPVVRRRVTEPLQRILQELRSPGHALAGAGGPRVPIGRKPGAGVALMSPGKGWSGRASGKAKEAAEERVASDALRNELRADGVKRHADLEKELGNDAIMESDLKNAERHWAAEERLRKKETEIRRGRLNN